jgi:AcrR family transcriptional regulator
VSPEARKAERRRKILDAALELFGTKGFSNTTVSELCRSAGVAPAKFYEAFSGMEAVLRELYDELGDRNEEKVILAVEAAPMDFESRVRVGLWVWCHQILDDIRVARVLLVEAVRVSPEMESRRRFFLGAYANFVVDQFYKIVSETSASGGKTVELDPTMARIVAVGLAGGCDEAISDWMRDPEPAPIELLIESMVEMYLAVGRSVSERGLQPSSASVLPLFGGESR